MTLSERTSTASEGQERRPLYKQRVFERVRENAEEIRSEMEASQREKLLNESQEAAFLRFENALGETLEKIFALSPKSGSVYTEYLLTEEGRDAFQKLFGISIEGDDSDSVKQFLLRHEPEIYLAKGSDRISFFRRTSDYQEQALFTELSKTMDDDGRIDVKNISAPDRVYLLLTPEESLERLQRLRQFKESLKSFHSELESGPHLGKEMENIVSDTLDLYLRRVNEMIVGSSSAAASLNRKVSLLGEETLSDSERSLLRISSISTHSESALSRLDKLVYGTSDESGSNGWKRQVGEELMHYASSLETEIITSALHENTSMKNLGLDQEKIYSPSLTPENTQMMGDELLAAYDLLSAFGPETFDPNDPKPAPDGKWRFVLHERYNKSGFATDSKSKTVKGPRMPLSIADVLPVLSHEIEGHVMQHENKERLPLRIFKRSGAGRWAAFAECAAMRNQDYVSRNAFGTSSLPGPHYVRAMAKRLDGGSYLECVNTHYESMLSLLRAKRDAGIIHSDVFQKEAQSALKRSVNRAKRLFASELDLNQTSPFLTNSKDTAYLEQTEVFRAFKESGIERLLYVGSANSETLRFLCKYRLINLNTVLEPKFHSLAMWKQMKNQYMLNEKD
jgi:hypothetical protein